MRVAPHEISASCEIDRSALTKILNIHSAEIKVDYYTINGEFIDTEVETVDFYESGGTSSFFIMYSGLRRGEIQHHVFYITSKKES